jgi:hypothetical protein
LSALIFPAGSLRQTDCGSALGEGIFCQAVGVIKRSDGVVSKTFVKRMEALGYDIELHYMKRRK